MSTLTNKKRKPSKITVLKSMVKLQKDLKELGYKTEERGELIQLTKKMKDEIFEEM